MSDSVVTRIIVGLLKKEKRRVRILSRRIESIKDSIWEDDLEESSAAGYYAYATLDSLRGQRMRRERTMATMRSRLK